MWEKARAAVVLVLGKGKDSSCPMGRGKDSSCPGCGKRQRQLSKLWEKAELVVLVVGRYFWQESNWTCPSCEKRHLSEVGILCPGCGKRSPGRVQLVAKSKYLS